PLRAFRRQSDREPIAVVTRPKLDNLRVHACGRPAWLFPREAKDRMMKRLPLIVLCCAIAAPVPAAAAKDVPQQAAAAPNWPSVKYEEKRPAVLRSGDLVVTLDTEPGSKPEYRVPTFKGVYQGRPIFTVRMPEKEDTDPEFAARVVRLDPKTALPQVVMT